MEWQQVNSTYEREALAKLCGKVKRSLNEYEDQQVDISELDAKPASVEDTSKYKVKLESESFTKNHEVEKGAEIQKTWFFRNIGEEKIPFDFKLVKVSGERDFGPPEIRINKTVS